MKTAVEWLEEQVIKFHNWKLNPVFDENCFDEIELRKAIQQAKAMEKEQIVNAYNDCEWTGDHEDGEQYYKETYENNN
jgi:hypothetical protein